MSRHDCGISLRRRKRDSNHSIIQWLADLCSPCRSELCECNPPPADEHMNILWKQADDDRHEFTVVPSSQICTDIATDKGYKQVKDDRVTCSMRRIRRKPKRMTNSVDRYTGTSWDPDSAEDLNTTQSVVNKRETKKNYSNSLSNRGNKPTRDKTYWLVAVAREDFSSISWCLTWGINPKHKAIFTWSGWWKSYNLRRQNNPKSK